MEPIKGRGTAANPANRFDTLRYERNDDDPPEDSPAPTTQLLDDRTRTVIARNDSPDVSFETSINPYRGCEHGCIYCYARPFHEYLGLSAGLDFESKILVKRDAAALLRKELLAPRWQPQVLMMSGVTDCYQPIERRLRLTRQCLEVLVEFGNPVSIVTKNHLVTRDCDVLSRLARVDAARVMITITTLDPQLAQLLEPRATRPQGRLDAIRELTSAGISTGVMVAPLIPGLTDHEMPAILAAARAAGAITAGYVVLRLPHGVSELFEKWLEEHFPDKKSKVLGRVRELREGRMNDGNFGSRMVGKGALADLYGNLFDVAVRKAGFPSEIPPLSTVSFRRPNDTPLSLFD